MIFNFSHTDVELREVIQAIEHKIQTLQTLLQKMVNEANVQAAPAIAQQTAEPAADESHGGSI